MRMEKESDREEKESKGREKRADMASNNFFFSISGSDTVRVFQESVLDAGMLLYVSVQ